MTDQKNNIADGRGLKYHRIEYIYKSIWFVPNIDKNNTDPETDNYWDAGNNCDITETDSNSYTEPLGGGFII